jgi:hypothetical protein
MGFATDSPHHLLRTYTTAVTLSPGQPQGRARNLYTPSVNWRAGDARQPHRLRSDASSRQLACGLCRDLVRQQPVMQSDLYKHGRNSTDAHLAGTALLCFVLSWRFRHHEFLDRSRHLGGTSPRRRASRNWALTKRNFNTMPTSCVRSSASHDWRHPRTMNSGSSPGPKPQLSPLPTDSIWTALPAIPKV